MKCAVCGKEIPRGKKYHGEKYKSLSFCSEECYNNYIIIKTKPKPLVNFKPEPKTDRRAFTDYIQEWCDDQCNWPFIMKQAKDIQEEYELDWREMRLICKYARVYEMVEWNNQYGLGQIFPRYIQPYKDFINKINLNKSLLFEEDVKKEIKKKKYIGKIIF